MRKLKDLVPWRGSSAQTPAGYPLGSLQGQMNRLFDDFFNGFGLEPFGRTGSAGGEFIPKINVEETETEIVVTAEVPGMSEKDIDIRLTDDHLELVGEKKLESERKEGQVTYFESSYGKFQRIVPLGIEVDHDKVDASLEKGQLIVKLPKIKASQPKAKQVSIRSA